MVANVVSSEKCHRNQKTEKYTSRHAIFYPYFILWILLFTLVYFCDCQKLTSKTNLHHLASDINAIYLIR